MNNRNICIVETGNRFGVMSSASSFYPKSYTKSKRESIFMKNRFMASLEYGFDPNYIFMARQTKKNGSYKLLDRDFVYSYNDGTEALIDEDILIVTDDLAGVVIGHSCTDFPVVMMSDIKKGVSAIGYCSGEMLDRKLPIAIADALYSSYGSLDQDIRAYVSACSKSNFVYKSFPSFITNEKNWENDIVLGDDGFFHVYLNSVIYKQLLERNISNFNFNLVDTVTDPLFYSSYSDTENKGRNFAGLFYKDNSKVLTKVKTK